MDTSAKFLVYDLLDLINSGKSESCLTIEHLIQKGNLVDYLLGSYPMKNIRKYSYGKIALLFKDRAGIFDFDEFNQESGFLYLIKILLDC